MEFIIRPAELSDSEVLLELTLNGIQDWSAPVQNLLAPWIEETCNLEYVEKRFENNDYHIFVAEQDTVIIGTIYLNTSNPHKAYAGGLYLTNKQKGIGSGLLKYLLQYAKKQGCERIECDIYEENKLAIRLTETYGAVKTDSLLYDDVNYLIYTFML